MWFGKQSWGVYQLVTLVVVVILSLTQVNLAIRDQEQHLAQGRKLLLALEPVDPRSIMQGDYMRIRLTIQEQISAQLPLEQQWQGLAILRLDQDQIGHFVRLVEITSLQRQIWPNWFAAKSQQDRVAEAMNGAASKDDEVDYLAIQFVVRDGQVQLANHDSFFFQQDQADHYQQATYGVYKVNQQGDLLLVDLVANP